MFAILAIKYQNEWHYGEKLMIDLIIVIIVIMAFIFFQTEINFSAFIHILL